MNNALSPIVLIRVLACDLKEAVHGGDITDIIIKDSQPDYFKVCYTKSGTIRHYYTYNYDTCKVYHESERID